MSAALPHWLSAVTLNIFDPAPDFRADSTIGPLDFHAWKGGEWAALFSCPFAFTPVCTTELGMLARRGSDFERRGVKVLVTTVDTLDVYPQWQADIARLYGAPVGFPLVADHDHAVAKLYGMIAPDELNVLPVLPGRWMKRVAEFANRTLFLISPSNRIAVTISYPPNVGLNFDEIIRVLDGLQMGKHKLAIPADWQQGDEMVVGRVLPDSVARARFGKLRTATHYLRFTDQPGYELWRR